jgi:hypothetical protein
MKNALVFAILLAAASPALALDDVYVAFTKHCIAADSDSDLCEARIDRQCVKSKLHKGMSDDQRREIAMSCEI